ncbi:MAG TPA: hypothetical protein VKZ99_05540 [Gammaproteobacteria bacterium]|nr:hypothetical protein [Gammaproteobacteria bacterium]
MEIDMDERKKGRLLARIEGQLAFVDARPHAAERHERRIDDGLMQLRRLLAGREEGARFERITNLVKRSRDGTAPASTRAHWRMLARADCLVWQLRLRQERPAHDAAA